MICGKNIRRRLETQTVLSEMLNFRLAEVGKLGISVCAPKIISNHMWQAKYDKVRNLMIVAVIGARPKSNGYILPILSQNKTVVFSNSLLCYLLHYRLAISSF